MEHRFSWVNPKLTEQASAVDGIGLVSGAPLKKDEILIVQGGQCLHIDEIDAAEMDRFSYLGFQVEERIYLFPVFINGSPVTDGIFKVNHSCEPNAGFRGQITLVAMRDIEVGEEITFDYAMTDIEFEGDIAWDVTECRCESTRCRKKITGHDWKRPDLQTLYAGYFSTHVANAIAEQGNNG